MHPLRMIAFCSAVAAPLAASIACSSKQSTATSGGAHYEIVSGPASASVALRCDDQGKQATIATIGDDGKPKLIVDGQDGATVNCQYDDAHYNVRIIDKESQLVAASGTFQSNGKVSQDAQISLGFGGTTYKSAGGPCTVTFTEKENAILTGFFICPEIDDQRTAKECGVTNTNPDGSSRSYFKFHDCTGF